jgi:hypothetical protein
LPLLLLILSAATDTGQWYDACRSTQVSITYYFDSTVSEHHLFKAALTAAADSLLLQLIAKPAARRQTG